MNCRETDVNTIQHVDNTSICYVDKYTKINVDILRIKKVHCWYVKMWMCCCVELSNLQHVDNNVIWYVEYSTLLIMDNLTLTDWQQKETGGLSV